jgi:hypothetical protein
MDISAIKRKAQLSKPDSNLDNHKKSVKIAIRLNATLHLTIRNYLSSMHSVADYRHNSIADILRQVLSDIEDKSLKLSNVKAPVSDGSYIELTQRCTYSQKRFRQTLQTRTNTRILEKAIIAFLQI